MNRVAFFTLDELQSHLQSIAINYSKVLCIADSNTFKHCFDRLDLIADTIVIPAGEEHKNIASCISIWEQLTQLNVDRNALILSLGGGMITDLGSFAVSCFKRGVPHINIPTSLLGMVDASVGGKTGIDFMGFKNQIGVFDSACESYICSELLSTLPARELNSAWAEIIKHYLIHDGELFREFTKKENKNTFSNHEMQSLIERAVAIKSHFVTQDPFDKGVRKALNFGHTIGHAIESYYLSTSTPLLHGEAVAIGMIAETYISFCKGKISENDLTVIVRSIHNRIMLSPISSEALESIYLLSLQDKKNSSTINCVLLSGIGQFELDIPINRDEILLSLNHYNSTCEQHTS
ncbi:MAG: 3-dehydroquinate synthase [Chitinophagales bacterium]|nr:3-dehydroquinate synthase [Chitinophagales bacterium]